MSGVFRKTVFLVLLISLLFIQSYASGADGLNRKSALLLKIVNEYHYRPPLIDEKFSADFVRRYMQTLDPYGMIFLKEDCTALCSQKIILTATGSCEVESFAGRSAGLYRTRVAEARNIIDELRSRGFDYNEQSVIRFDRNVADYPQNKNELVRRWRNRLVYRVLEFFYKKNYTGKPLAGYEKIFAQEEPELRLKAADYEKKILKQILYPHEGYEPYMSAVFLDTLARQFDPHSAYLTSGDKQRLGASLSSRAPDYGITFTAGTNGEIIIDRLVPGGPAWKSSKLNKGDVLREVYFPKNKTKYDAADFDYDDFLEVVYRSEFDVMTITVRKKNGSLVAVSLKKEKLDVEENRITSYILDGDKKIGYICLPAFYAEIDFPNVPACANDVAKEILKLKKDAVEGIILDLRDNGGGSLLESVQLTGIFIDEGPVCIQGTRSGKNYLIKDPSRGTVYDGPLLVMVNGGSASASEFFAASMKDYGRAIITGSATYGKASSQIILPLVGDASKADEKKIKYCADGYVKVTTNMYYDLSGNTHQLSGVVPDVFLPERFGGAGERESDYKNGLKKTTIKKNVAYSANALPRAYLAKASSRRVSSNRQFRQIVKSGERFRKSVYEKKEFSLDIRRFIQERNDIADIFDAMEKACDGGAGSFKGANTSYDAEIIRFDSNRKITNKEILDSIARDLYINESYTVLKDYIQKK